MPVTSLASSHLAYSYLLYQFHEVARSSFVLIFSLLPAYGQSVSPNTPTALTALLSHRIGRKCCCLLLLLLTISASAYGLCPPPPTIPPGAPTITAAAGKAKITLTWGAVTDANSYGVYLYNADGSSTLRGAVSTGTSYVDTAVQNGTTFSYFVIATGCGGSSNWSNLASATPTLDAPGVMAMPGKAKITVSWNSVGDADSYKVYRYNANGSTTALSLNHLTTSYVDTAVSNGTTSSYIVLSNNAAGPSNWSNIASATPILRPPAGLRASWENGQARVSWNSVTDADGYHVYRYNSDGSTTARALNYIPTSFLDTADYGSSVVFFFVIAYNAAGQSNWSSLISTDGRPTPLACDPCAPLDSPNVGNSGGSRPAPVNLATGTESFMHTPDLQVYNPSGPSVAWQRQFLSYQALSGYGSPGLSPGWVHTYDNSLVAQPPSTTSSDTVWVEDALPAGAGSGADNDAWTWVNSSPTQYSGTLAHRSSINAGFHQHYFYSATNRLTVNQGDVLYAYVYLDPSNLPNEIMLQWSDGSWEHRAYWGSDNIGGVAGTASHRYMGPLPAAGQWVRLQVPAAQVGLEGKILSGMSFLLYGGRATWDNGAVETLTPVMDGNGQPTGALTAPAGVSYVVQGVPGASAGQWQSVTITWKDQTKWQFVPLISDTYPLSQITDRLNRSLDLVWSASRALIQVRDATSGTALLNLTYGGDGRLARVTDVYDREIDYSYSTPVGSDPGLLQSVSQVVATGTANPPAQWTYGYTSNGQLLHTASVPSPTGNGSSTTAINYDGFGRVSSLVDANGNQRVYTYNTASTQVQVKNAANTVVQTWTQKISGQRNTGVTDANNQNTSIEYGDIQNPVSRRAL